MESLSWFSNAQAPFQDPSCYAITSLPCSFDSHAHTHVWVHAHNAGASCSECGVVVLGGSLSVGGGDYSNV